MMAAVSAVVRPHQGMTVEEFFREKMPDRRTRGLPDPGEACDPLIGYRLQENNRITITPTKIEGAA